MSVAGHAAGQNSQYIAVCTPLAQLFDLRQRVAATRVCASSAALMTFSPPVPHVGSVLHLYL